MPKRLFDIGATFLLLPFALPVGLLVGAAVRIGLGRPVLYPSKRAGLHGRVFTLYKFRTMTDDRDAAGDLLPDEQRIPKLGKVLRSSSLDELPSLLNVLKGDMSLVGPRPLNDFYLDRYTPTQARRHEVRPGITGLAQVRGRNALPWPERLAMDVEYVDTRSLALDIKILLQTIGAVVRRSGISEEGSATMTEFLGTEGEEPA